MELSELHKQQIKNEKENLLKKNKNIEIINTKNKKLQELISELDDKEEEVINYRKKIQDNVDLLETENKKIESLTLEIDQQKSDLSDVIKAINDLKEKEKKLNKEKFEQNEKLSE
jgi:hypothetical protein